MLLRDLIGIDLPVAKEPAGWLERGPLPYFWGRSFDEHVTEWRLVDTEVQNQTWKFAAITFSLERSSGGRPRGERKRISTAIQRFCEAVKTDRQTFQRLCRTYRVFSSITRTTGGTGFECDLPFKYYEVAARLAGSDAADAIAEARAKGWSANRLERELDSRREPSQNQRRQVSLRQARERIFKMIEAWPTPDQRDAVTMLRTLADEIEKKLGPVPSVRPVPSVSEFIAAEAERDEDAIEPAWQDAIGPGWQDAIEPAWQDAIEPGWQPEI